ncbi:MAG: CHAT domain-containing protein, partial [Propionibacteriales bacterium]|nr:CHAT domain-containing protein [Propionibacteriales bacterium]
RQAQLRFLRRGSESWALQADLVRLAARVAAGKSPAACQVESMRLAAEFRSRGLTEEERTAWLVAARALVAAKRPAEARVLARRPLPRTASITTRLLAHTVRAEIAEAMDDRRAAFDAARRGLQELQEWQASFGGLDLQTGLSGHGRDLAKRGLSLAVRSRRPDVVFTWVQRARALVSRLPPVTPPDDAQARDALEELRQVRVALQSDVGKALVTRRRQLEEQIRQQSWHNLGPGVVTGEVTLDQMQAELAAHDGCLVAHLVAHGTMHALVVTPSETYLLPLCKSAKAADLLHRVRADLDAAASDLAPVALVPVFQASLRQSLDDLAAQLWDPIAAKTGTGPVLLVPAGGFAALPWTMLDGLAGRPVSVARSVGSWFASRAGAPVAAVERVGLVAGPRVPRAGEEVARAKSAWSSATALVGADATTGHTADLVQRVDLLHVAAHGRHETDNPLFSSLELVDGPWFGHDVAALGRLPRNVILSACELGMSTVRWGDETLGMTAAWLHAGTDSVISAVADVNDAAACDVLAEVHHGLASGLLPAAALAQAMAKQDSAAPVPFVCFGAGW